MQDNSISELLNKRDFDFTKLIIKEISTLDAECNFNEEERLIFHYRIRGLSILEISEKLHISTRTVDRRIYNIRGKIEKWNKVL